MLFELIVWIESNDIDHKTNKELLSINSVRYKSIASSIAIITIIAGMIPNTAIVAAEEWKIYKVIYEGQTFRIPYKITNGDVMNIEYDSAFASFVITVQSESDKYGEIEVTIPRNLASPTSSQGDERFVVLLDGDETDYKEVNNSPCFRTISIPLPAGSKQIEIIAAMVTQMPPKGYTVRVNVPSVYIATDKNNYEVGESIKVLGCTDLGLDDKMVVLEILNPEGKIYETVSMIPNINGSFLTSFAVDGQLAINGTYTAKASYADRSVTSSFVVPEFPAFTIIIFASAISFILIVRLRNELKM